MITGVLSIIISVYMLIVLIYAVMTWIPGLKGSPMYSWLKSLVEPLCGPIRQLLGPIQGSTGIDFSPAVLILILYLIQILI